MNVPTNLKYTLDHEWVKIENDIASIGITDYAQEELGDIVFIEFPEIGDSFEKGELFGTIEAVKTVAELYLPLSGEIVEINEDLDGEPEKVNSDPFGDGWIIKMKLTDSGDGDELLDARAYKKIIG